MKDRFQKMRGLFLDFDGVMTDNRVLVTEDGKEGVFCNRSDSLGIEMLKKKGVGVFVISKEKNKVVQIRCQKLDIQCLNAVDDKYPQLLKEVERMGLKMKDICFIGNDLNDLECIKNAGIGVAVADSHKSVLRVADYITKKKGGQGAVREVIDLIL